jgi:type 1 glutamine amidotransferase
LCLALCILSGSPARPRKIVLIAGKKSHGPGEHEYLKTIKLLKVLLDRSPNLHGIQTEIYFNGWPDNPKTLDTADTIVVISDGQDHDESPRVPIFMPERMHIVEKQMARGCGFVTFHFSTFISYEYADQVLEWNGGFYEWDEKRGRTSAIKTVETDVKLGAPGHPVLTGVQPFHFKDEFYYQIRFRHNDPRLRLILQVPVLSPVPEDQTVAWAVERQNGGRGFGTTTGHYFANWRNENYRKLILNAIVWTAGADVPAGGVESTFVEDDEVDRVLHESDSCSDPDRRYGSAKAAWAKSIEPTTSRSADPWLSNSCRRQLRVTRTPSHAFAMRCVPHARSHTPMSAASTTLAPSKATPSFRWNTWMVRTSARSYAASDGFPPTKLSKSRGAFVPDWPPLTRKACCIAI